jgi:plasmid stabilization system protein ParE
LTIPRFLPGARVDFLDAIDHYVGGSRTLAADFLDEVVRNLDLVTEFPEASPIARGEVRKKVMRRFPYSLLYLVDGGVPVVVAVMHHHRRPDYWHHRVG